MFYGRRKRGIKYGEKLQANENINFFNDHKTFINIEMEIDDIPQNIINRMLHILKHIRFLLTKIPYEQRLSFFNICYFFLDFEPIGDKNLTFGKL